MPVDWSGMNELFLYVFTSFSVCFSSTGCVSLKWYLEHNLGDAKGITESSLRSRVPLIETFILAVGGGGRAVTVATVFTAAYSKTHLSILAKG